MPKRKTIKVERALELANNFLAKSVGTPELGQGMRSGVASLIEEILCETGNYSGFRYLDESEVPAGQLAGVHRWENDKGETEVSFPDESRRQYS